MSVLETRIYNYQMEHYRHVYQNSRMWMGDESIDGKRVIIYCEQGLGDIVQFIRYLPKLKSLGCHTILHCPDSLHCVLPYIQGIDEWFSKYTTSLPDHDYHVLALDLPFLALDKKPVDITNWWEGKELDKYMPQVSQQIPSVPYIRYTEKHVLEQGYNVGICWAGNPEHWNNSDRSCHLKHFRSLRGRLISLQKNIEAEYVAGSEDTELWGCDLDDILSVIRLINAVDVVVTVDTLILHLAGALAKKTFGMLGNKPDMRWPGTGVSPWYPTVTFCRKKDDDWASAFNQLPAYLQQ